MGAILGGLILSACGEDAPSKAHESQNAIMERVDGYNPSGRDYASDEALKTTLSERGVVWSTVLMKGDTIRFTGLELEQGVSFETLELTAPNIYDDYAPYAELVTFSGYKFEDLSVASGKVIIPSSEVFNSFMEIAGRGDSDPSYASHVMDKTVDVLQAFDGGGYLEGVDSAEVEIDFIGWISEVDKASISFLIEDLNFVEDDINLDSAELQSIEIEQIKLTNFDLEIFRHYETDSPEFAASMAARFYNPFEPTFESLEITNLHARSEHLGFEIPSLSWAMADKTDQGHTNFFKANFLYDISEDMLPDSPEETVESLEAMGMWPMQFSLSSETYLNRSADRFIMKSGRFAMGDNFDYILSFEVEGADKMFTGLVEGMTKTFQAMMIFGPGDAEAMSAGISESLAARDSLKLNQLTLTARDRGFIDGLVALAAKQRDVDIETVRSEIASSFALMTLGARSKYQADLAIDFADAAEDFGLFGGELMMTVRPDGGLLLKDVTDAIDGHVESGRDNSAHLTDEILKMLNIDFTHTPPN